MNYKCNVPFRVRSYEVNTSGFVHLSNICNYFQEAAGVHANEMNFDISDLKKNGITWVLHRLQVQVKKYPGRWSDISVNTWPSSGDGIRAYRDYELIDSNDNVLAAGLSHWMMLHIHRRRPVRIPDHLLHINSDLEEHVIAVARNKIVIVDNKEKYPVARVAAYDIDMNNHVNNVKYVEWAAGFMSDITVNRNIKSLDIQFLREAEVGEMILLSEKKDPGKNHVYRTLFRERDGEPVAAAVISFQ